jgi:hypothetical protein
VSVVNITSISIYCLPNIRAPWVVVYEPHPWGHGALRVKEDSALLIYRRVPTRYEREWMADAVTYFCRTFRTLKALLDYEDGQHEQVAEVREAVEFRRERVAAILAEVEKKRAAKRAEERRRSLPVVQPLNEVA